MGRGIVLKDFHGGWAERLGIGGVLHAMPGSDPGKVRGSSRGRPPWVPIGAPAPTKKTARGTDTFGEYMNSQSRPGAPGPGRKPPGGGGIFFRGFASALNEINPGRAARAKKALSS